MTSAAVHHTRLLLETESNLGILMMDEVADRLVPS
jgi:hypothetical protein